MCVFSDDNTGDLPIDLIWTVFSKNVLVDFDWEVVMHAIQFMRNLYELAQEANSSNCSELTKALCVLLKPLTTCGDHAVEENASNLWQLLNHDSSNPIVSATELGKERHLVFVADELQSLLDDVLFLLADEPKSTNVSVNDEKLLNNMLDCY